MKIPKSVIVVLMLLASVYTASADSGWMRVSLLEGDVQIKTAGSGDWGPASLNGPVTEGDQIWVPQGGRVELQLNAGTYVRLDQDSALQILATEENSSQFYLSQGHAYVYYDAPPGGAIQMDTPDASTRAFETAVFRIDMSDEYQYTDVAVYKGYVETENQLGRTRVNAGDMVSLGEDTNGEVAPMGAPDEWERWNKERNDRIAERGASWRHLPPELRAYSYDLDANGRWVDVPDYGYCWTPTVIGAADWAPYREGRWIWRGGEYIWVSFDPWGWAPYHYGRWAFVVRTGWCWIPPAPSDVYWGPGYVGWVSTGDYVAWVPLAPGEIYYGRGYYGRHSVNITKMNISQIHITNVYRNVSVSNGATVVSRRTFATRSPKIAGVSRNIIERQIFTRNNIHAGAPAIKPTKETYFASTRHIPPAKLPPRSVRDIEITHLKQSRPFVKAPERSVLNPKTRPAPLPLRTVRTPRTRGKEKPEIQRVMPQEHGRPGTPERGLVPRGARPLVKPEQRPAPAERHPAPKIERPEVRQPERKPAPVERRPAPKVERPEVRQPEQRPAPVERRPAPKVERPEVRQPEQRPVPVERRPAPKVERPEVRHPGRRLVPAGRPSPGREKKAVEPEKKKEDKKNEEPER